MDRFETEVTRLMAERGVVIGADGRWVKSPHHTGPKAQLSDEEIRFLNERAPTHDIDARLKLQWVEHFWEAVSVLNDQGVDAPWPFLGVFWIRLQGILVDLRMELGGLAASLEIDPKTYKANPGSLLESALRTLTSMEKLRGVLNEDELVYADYRRHTEAHPTQGAYDLRWSKKRGEIVENYKPQATGREFTVTELDAAIRRVLSAHPSEAATAVAFAKRMHGPALELVGAMRRWCSST